MAVSVEYLQYVLGQLGALRDLNSRRMFGGVGLYQGRRMFGLIAGDTVYFKVDDSSRGGYLARNMHQFRPFVNKPHISMNYYAVPADILEDPEQCVGWALQSAAIASDVKKSGSRRTPKAGPGTRGAVQ